MSDAEYRKVLLDEKSLEDEEEGHLATLTRQAKTFLHRQYIVQNFCTKAAITNDMATWVSRLIHPNKKISFFVNEAMRPKYLDNFNDTTTYAKSARAIIRGWYYLVTQWSQLQRGYLRRWACQLAGSRFPLAVSSWQCHLSR
jgi:hypothetical protein